MKLHLPHPLYRAVLACFAAAALVAPAFADVPSGYTSVTISNVTQLGKYKSTDKIAFLIASDINDTLYGMSGSNQYWTSANSEAPVILTFSGLKTGAINSSYLEMEGFWSLVFDKSSTNSQSSNGGAIHGSTISLTNNGDITFSGNYSFSDSSSYLSCGGAIYGGISSTINLTNNGDITFSGNYASSTTSYSSSYSYGGAIYGGISSTINLTNNGDITFSGNYAASTFTTTAISTTSSSPTFSSYGGAIYGDSSSTINLTNNGGITFSNNYAASNSFKSFKSSYSSSYSYGGAIYGGRGITINLTNNGDITFSGNYASSSSSTSDNYSDSYGGAIYGGSSSTISLTNNGDITFSGNYASSSSTSSFSTDATSYGGAICGNSRSTINLTNNGAITFSGNYAASSSTSYAYSTSYGGAIYGDSTINLTNNGAITFSGNYASSSSSTSSTSYGGAIYGDATSKLSIAGNDSVTFRGNYEKVENASVLTYGLRSIYTIGSEMKLSAGVGQRITFYDSIYASSAVTVSYNASYVDADGVTQQGLGDIVFSGLYVWTDLYKLKSDYTSSERTDSLTSEVMSNARLYGGRLRIENGAIYKGTGLLTQTNSAARVVLNEGTINLSGDLLISSGTSLEVRGTGNKVTASSLTLNSGSTLSFVLAASHLTTAALTVTGDILKQKGELTLIISPDSKMTQDGAYMLMKSTTGASFTSWDSTKITISGLPQSADSLRWSGGTLYLDYTVPMAWTGAFSDTWDEGTPNWSKNGGEVTYQDALSVEFGNGASGTVQLAGALAPRGVLVNNDAKHAYTFAGSGKLTGTMVLAKSGKGTLTIDTANDYTGGTAIYGGTLMAKQATALGTGKVQLSGGTLVIGDAHVANSLTSENTSAVTIAKGVVWAPTAVIANSGTLTVSGAIDASALTLVTTDTDTHIDVQGNSGACGFEKLAERSVQLVNGGTTVGTAAQVTHRDLNEKLTLVLGADGVARAGGTVDYSNYLLTGSVVARSSVIHAVEGAASAAITMQSGTLTVDDAADVTATGGSLYLSGGTLSGTLNGVAVTATSGTIDAAFSGSSKLTGSKFALESALQNSGTLTLSGTFDISAMEMGHIDACRTDVNGNRGDSGFATGEGYAVQVVIGGTTVGTNATLTHGENTLKLDSNGYASTSLQTDYSNYLLTGSDAVTTAAVHAKSSAATITQTGGTLTVNDTATVTSTGGTILLAGGTLNGSVNNATVSATNGTLNATLGGNTLLVGSNYALQGVLVNSGSLTLNGSFNATALTLNSSAATHVDVNGNSGASGFAKDAEYSVRLVNGGTVVNDGASVTHGSHNLTLGSNGVATKGGDIHYDTYLLTGSATATTSAIHGKNSSAAVSMNGGTLTVNDTATVTATSGKLTLSGGTLNGTLSGTTITAASGTITATLNLNNTLNGSNYALKNVIANNGTLTIGGTLDVSALTLNATEATHVDVNGNSGDCGFAKTAGYSVQLVNGGTVVNNSATIKHGSHTLALGSNGEAAAGGTMDYSTYLLTGIGTVTTAAVHTKSSAATITQTSGTLTVNDTATVTSTGGTILLANGTLNGSVNNATVSATIGTLNATLGGNTLLVGSNYALQKAITNSGTLTLNGSFNADALNLNTTAATHVDVNGISGASGFAKAGDSSVRVVNGGTVVNDNATVTHGNLVLTLGADGIARAVGATDYRVYMLTGSGVASSTAIHAFNAAATVMMNGGTLVADDAVSVTATGGSLALQGGSISGSLQNVSVTASAGNIQTAFAGNSSLVGQSYALNGAILNSGTLTLRGSFAADNLTLRHLDATRVDVNGNSGTSGFAKDEAYAVTLVNGGTVVNGGTTVTHGSHTLVLGADGVATEGGAVNYGNYLLVSGASATTSAIHAFNAAAGVTMSGGFLTVDDGAAVTATGGMLTLNGGLLSGTLNNVTLTANGGSLSATLGGTTTLTGNQYRLTSALMNEGTLMMGGSFDASSLQLNTTENTHVDVNGKSGASGFAKYGDSSVTLVNGGTVMNNNAVVTHGNLTLTLDADGIARATGTTVYSEYLLTGIDTVSTAAVHAKSNSATITQTGGTLTVNDTATVNATAGNIALTGGTLNGTLSGTSITATGGTLAATLNGANTLNGSSYALKNVIANSGTLTMSGSFNANALTLNTTAATHVDVNGNSGTSGFVKDAVYSVQLVNGGTVVNNGATVTHGTHTLTLGSNGVATEGGAIHYDTYLLTGSATATTSAIHGKNSAASITQTGGTLTVNDTATVNATSGKLTLSGGTLNGTLTGTTITATSGTIAAALNGSNTLNGSSYALKNVIANNGTLTIGGTLDVSALTLNTTAATHVDVNGNSGASGFAKTAAYSVQVVNGGSTVNNGATIKHGTRTLTLNSDGTATTGGVVSYTTYLLTGNDTVSVSAIRSKSSTATVTQTGGTLTANGTASVTTTGGSIALTSGTLSGTIANADVTASGGTLKATFNGSNTLNGSNYALGSVVSNSGTLTMSGSFNASSLTLNTTAATHVDVNGNTGSSGFTKDAAYSVKLVNGGTVVNNDATVKHGTRTLELGSDGYATAGGDVHYDTYLLTGTATATTSAIHGKSSKAVVSMNGGSLTVNDTATVTATGGTVTLTSGTLNGTLTNTSIQANGGTLAADVTGSKTLTVGGNVTVKGLVSSSVMLNSGRLTASNGLELESGQTLTFNGGRMTGDVLTTDGSTLAVKTNSTLTGDLMLDGGALALNGKTLTLTGALNLLSETALDVSSYGIGEYKLFSFGALAGSLDNLCIDSKRYRYALSQENNALMLTVKALNNTLTWNSPKGVWTTNGAFGSGVFEEGDDVIFRTAAAVTITGAVEPGEMLVDSAAAVKFTANAKTLGSGIIGKGTLTKNGAGMLTLNAGNRYSGGTVLNEGTIKAAAADSFGTGAITVNGGTLDLASKAVSNNVVLAGSATLKGDANLSGHVNVEGNATLLAKSAYKGRITIGSGNTLNLAAAATVAGSLDVAGGRLNIAADKGLTIAKGMSLRLNGGTVKGLVNVGAGSVLDCTTGTLLTTPTLSGGTLTTGGTGTLTLSGTGTLKLGTQTVSLKSKGEIHTDRDLTVTDGKVTMTGITRYNGAMAVKGGTFSLGKVASAADIAVTGSAALNNGALHSGDINVSGELLKGTAIKLTRAGQRVNLNHAGVMSGAISGIGIVNVNANIDASLGKLTNSVVNLNSGTLTNNKGLKLVSGQTLTFNGGNMNLVGKVLTTAAGSTLHVEKSATLSGALTLSKATTLTLDGTATLTFGTLTVPKKGTLEDFFGVGSDVTIRRKGNTLTFIGASVAACAAPETEEFEVVAAAAPEGDVLIITPETVGAPALAVSPSAELAKKAVAARPLGDALVMADWGIVDANRAFTGTLQSRRDSGVLLADGQGMAWVSAMGGVSRHGSENGHNGADVNLNGAAVGVEHTAGKDSVLGLAVGHTWSRIGATGMQHLRQDTAHVALYGQTKLPHGFTAEWSAAYGDTDSKGSFYGTRETWSQKSTSLSARLNKTHELTDTTAVRGFAGLSYDATDAASIHGMHTGSIQRLQGEVGAGITHRADKLTTYAEASVTTDLARNTPAVDFGAWRQGGATPGRTGLNLTLGAAYELTDKWSINAAYHMEAAERATQHSFNVGVGRKF